MFSSRATLSTAGLVARRAALGVGVGASIGGVATVGYAYSDQGVGFRREVHFWSVIAPVIFDYWWNAASSSPYVRYKKYSNPEITMSQPAAAQTNEQPDPNSDKGGDEEEAENSNQQEKYAVYRELHERNAPRIFQVMLDLGGLYIKLGQVLSVTVLPIPHQYRDVLKTLQSNVPGHEEFTSVIKPTLEKEFGRSLEEIFDEVEETPCGAASIGQAHKAKLKESGEQVIIKVQYPDAKWQVPADIQCVGDFMKVCVYFGIIDESAAQLSFDEFSRQFLMELDYHQEKRNLEEVYASSIKPDAPYIRRGVVIPRVLPELCTNQVVTMTYLPGPKFEEEAKQQLQMLGIDTKKRIRDVVQQTTSESEIAQNARAKLDVAKDAEPEPRPPRSQHSWALTASRAVSQWVGVDFFLSLVRMTRRIVLWTQVAAVSTIRAASVLSLVPTTWEEWAVEHQNAALQASRWNWTHEAIYALFDVHGYQIFREGLFNGDPHPGNILIVQSENSQTSELPKIGLIDYGQCKRLTQDERVRVAKLILSVANNMPDEEIADRFRKLGIQTRNDSTAFLAQFAKLMFGPFQPYHMDRKWHRELHKEDKVLYFPNELTMVYRTATLLRGLALSLQMNVDVGSVWKPHAQKIVDESNYTAV